MTGLKEKFESEMVNATKNRGKAAVLGMEGNKNSRVTPLQHFSNLMLIC